MVEAVIEVSWLALRKRIMVIIALVTVMAAFSCGTVVASVFLTLAAVGTLAALTLHVALGLGYEYTV